MPTGQAAPGPTLVVVGGRRTGERLPVPTGQHSVGRDAGSAVRMDDDGVSHHHAVIVRAANTVTVEDAGSTNGTWVNGTRITAAQVLEPGDVVGVGAAAFRFEGVGGTKKPSTRGRGRVRIGRVVLIGGLANLVLLGIGVLIQTLTAGTGLAAWIAAPITGMVAALIEVAREAFTKAPEEAAAEGPAIPPGATPAPPGQTGQIRRPQRRAGVVAGILVAVLVVGVGGTLVVYGVATAVIGLITGDQGPGEERLAAPVTVDSGGIVVTITSVEQTNDFTRVDLTVQNNLTDTVTLPLFGYASLRTDSATLETGGVQQTWSESIPAGLSQQGTIVFSGHLPDDAATATFAFATVFGPGSLQHEGAVIVSGAEYHRARELRTPRSTLSPEDDLQRLRVGAALSPPRDPPPRGATGRMRRRRGPGGRPGRFVQVHHVVIDHVGDATKPDFRRRSRGEPAAGRRREVTARSMESITTTSEAPTLRATPPRYPGRMRARIGLLGRFVIAVDDRVVPGSALARRDPARLIKLLALTPGHSMHREQLIDALWPEVDSPDNRLHKAGHFVRRAVGSADAIVIGGDAVTLFPGGEVTTDVESSRRSLARPCATIRRRWRRMRWRCTRASCFPWTRTRTGRPRRASGSRCCTANCSGCWAASTSSSPSTRPTRAPTSRSCSG